LALGASYATLAQLKARLGSSGIAWPDTNDDAPLTNALAAASQSIEGYCGRQFNDAGAATARVYYPDDLATIYTEDFSTSAGLIVAFDFSNSGTYSSVIAASNYQLEPLNNIFDGTPNWPFYRIHIIQTWTPIWWTSIGYPRTSIQITAQWGWATVPPAVVEATLMLGEEIFKMKDSPFGVAGFSQYGAVRVRDNPKVNNMLARYVRAPIQVA